MSLNYLPGADRPSPPLDRLFHALADPARRCMVEQLCHGPRSLGALAGPLPMSLPAVLQHLRVLEQAGLVTTRKNGRVRECTLRSDALALAGSWISDRRQEWEQRLDRLEQYLDQLQMPTQGDPDDQPT